MYCEWITLIRWSKTGPQQRSGKKLLLSPWKHTKTFMSCWPNLGYPVPCSWCVVCLLIWVLSLFSTIPCLYCLTVKRAKRCENYPLQGSSMYSGLSMKQKTNPKTPKRSKTYLKFYQQKIVQMPETVKHFWRQIWREYLPNYLCTEPSHNRTHSIFS